MRRIRLQLCTAAMAACLLAACHTHAQMHNSARIMALGGSAVSGIIPDYYTDLMINPAYAALSSRFVLNYGYRESPGWYVPYPQLNSGFDLNFPQTIVSDTNEFLAYGLVISGWHLAASAEWYLKNDDETTSDIDYSAYSSSYMENYTTNRYKDERNYLHAALLLARPLGGGASFGVRVSATDYYYRRVNQRDYRSLQYSYESHDDEMALTEDYRRYSYEENMYRWISVFLQVGLLLDGDAGRRSEYILSVSRQPVYSRRDDFELSIRTSYDAHTQVRENYYYDRFDWFDRKDGDLWTVSLAGRRVFGGGFTVYGGARFEYSPYESDWSKQMRYFTWQGYNKDMKNYLTMDADGDRTALSVFAKGGKTWTFERKLDMTVGIGGSFSRAVNEEPGSADRTRRVMNDEETVEDITDSSPTTLDVEAYTAAMIVPLALEFKPARYFTCFTGFTTQVRWQRETDSYCLPTALLADRSPSLTAPPSERSAAGALLGAAPPTPIAEMTDDQVATSYGATIGFSLNYKDRLFCDLYTGSDLTPDNVTYYVMDLRYRF